MARSVRRKRENFTFTFTHPISKLTAFSFSAPPRAARAQDRPDTSGAVFVAERFPFGFASTPSPMRSLLLLLWHFVCSATSTVNSSNHNGHSCQPRFAASSLQISLGAAKTPVWLYKQSHAEANNLPDFHPVAYRTADGQAHLMITHFENYRISGATLDSLSSTQKTFDSEGSWHSIDWGNFGHHQWVGAPFTNDGKVFCSLRLVSSPCPRPHPRHCPHPCSPPPLTLALNSRPHAPPQTIGWAGILCACPQ